MESLPTFLPPGTLAAFGLYLVRTSAMVLAAPIFGTGTGFSMHRVALIVALAFLFYAASGTPLASAPSPLEFGAFAGREILIGVALGFVLHLATLAVRVGGEMIGQEMGFSMAAQVDPQTGVGMPLVAQFYDGLFLVGFLAVDGHHWLIRALSGSFERAPVGHLGGTGQLSSAIEALFTQMFTAGVVFAAPVMVLMFLVSVMIALIGRAVPQINLMDMGFTLRILCALVAMYAFAPMTAPAMERLYAAVQTGLESVLGSLQPA
ncbi:MAG TPA: flagellar biosynthetic protein FliR [Planctomycetota bacterium]|nr:flagellar biosynthetic protein FliR [Planctomycetota bacterium]